MGTSRSKALNAHLTTAIAALIRAQAEAEIVGAEGVDHDLFLIRLEVQRLRDRGSSCAPRIPGQTDLLSELRGMTTRVSANNRA